MYYFLYCDRGILSNGKAKTIKNVWETTNCTDAANMGVHRQDPMDKWNARSDSFVS